MATEASLWGTWKMVSWTREIIATGECVDALGPNPVGFISYAPDHRVQVLVVGAIRPKPLGAVPSDLDKVRLFTTMLAYAGTYTMDDEKVVHRIEASWNESWTGTEQVRSLRLEGDRLTLTAPPSIDPHTGQDVIHRVVFERLTG
jgi:hypothetical protein